ncbi:tetratricopeptide repeat protein, partial [Vibrio tasmaniensis]|uniref:tetratricopeptide repeat protein n=1 Tax=Vibrio tasmaniensis TaxID=212663 RepID=UPI0013018F95
VQSDWSRSDCANERYQIHEIEYDNASNIVEHNLPIRLTANFEGRVRELELLNEWLEDEDSRRCLIYGDGGYGKTTLLLEYLNRLLDGELSYSWFNPSLICFYTAKMTLWTADGLEYTSTRPPIMDECLRELMLCFYPVLDKKWFEVSGRALIDKVSGELSNRKYGRNDVLLIIDNSETLAKSNQETSELASFLKLIGKKVGRVIITSRRQENIEATPILVSALDDDDCVKLLKNLAKDHGAEAINKAGKPKLKKVAKKLMYKPILIEALVVYVSRSGLSIDAAIDNLYQKTDDDLLEFLYEDAWERLEEEQKQAFYIIVSLTKPLTDISIGKACQIVELQHSEFQSSLQETHFAMFTDYGNKYAIELVDLARRFFEKKLKEESELYQESIKENSIKVDTYATERERVELEYIEDRVFDAFRNEYAKAAKVEVDKERYDEAIELYKLAVIDDPCNSALHDRFAWLYLNKKSDPNNALVHAKKAVELNAHNVDALVLVALSYYYSDDLANGDVYIDLAEKEGRTKSFCLLRKAIARYHYAGNHTASIAILDDALSKLKLAERVSGNKTGYDAKNLKEIRKYHQLVLRRLFLQRKVN